MLYKCAWCNTPMGKTAIMGEELSHGICTVCFKREIWTVFKDKKDAYKKMDQINMALRKQKEKQIKIKSTSVKFGSGV